VLAKNSHKTAPSAIAHGTSQSGRFLRDLVYQGFNESEAGQIVFDGINPHIAAARLFLNYRFAQPNRAYSLGYGFLGFPDNGHSLLTTDAEGKADSRLPDNVRIYHIAGTQHVITPTMPKGVCAAMPNTLVDPRPVMRALILALDRWVKDGTPPPPSRYPRLSDGTLVTASALRFPPASGIMPRARSPRFLARGGYRENCRSRPWALIRRPKYHVVDGMLIVENKKMFFPGSTIFNESLTLSSA